MVSSKFSRHAHAFRVPDICKKKLEPDEEEGIPYPPPFVTYWYNVDVSWLFYHYVFSGSRLLEREATMYGNSWRYLDDPTPPADGQLAGFQHAPDSGQWNAWLRHYEGGVMRLTGQNTGEIPGSPEDLTTGPFEINFGPIWLGTRDGNITPAAGP